MRGTSRVHFSWWSFAYRAGVIQVDTNVGWASGEDSAEAQAAHLIAALKYGEKKGYFDYSKRWDPRILQPGDIQTWKGWTQFQGTKHAAALIDRMRQEITWHLKAELATQLLSAGAGKVVTAAAAIGRGSKAATGGGEMIAKLANAADNVKASKRTTWPRTANEMDEFLGVPGQRIPDGPTTPGRDKTVWRPNSNTKITLERHPYHPDAPDWHRDYHWHLDTPENPHQRFLPGDEIPGLGSGGGN